jgi:exonuclease III
MHTKNNKVAGIITYVSILRLNVNGLNSLIKGQRSASLIKKENQRICCLQETHLTDRNKHWLRVKGFKKIFQANGLQKQAEVTILMSGQIDFNPKFIRRDKIGHFILMKGRIIHQ